MRFVLGLILLLAPCLAAPGGAKAESVDCGTAAKLAEVEFGIPTGLLLAIGKVESGRAGGSGVQPWPWTTNTGGVGHYFNSPEEAIQTVRQETSVRWPAPDVGCFQISLAYHPDAFASLDEAFDPLSNARYAAKFLRELWQSAGSWEEAVARYHSADPARGQPYLAMVMQRWKERETAALDEAPLPSPGARVRPAAHWTRIGAMPDLDPYVIHVGFSVSQPARAPARGVRMAAADPFVIHIGR